MLPWKQHIRQLNYQKTKVRVINLLATIFGQPKGSWVLKKKVNETHVSKTVFSHLKIDYSRDYTCESFITCFSVDQSLVLY